MLISPMDPYSNTCGGMSNKRTFRVLSYFSSISDSLLLSLRLTDKVLPSGVGHKKIPLAEPHTKTCSLAL